MNKKISASKGKGLIKHLGGRHKTTVIIISFLLICCSLFATDVYRLNHQFRDLKEFLSRVRLKAIFENKKIIVRFGKETVTSSEGNLSVPYLYEVRYDTKLGKNMIVFTGRGTSDYNIRIHGGDLTLKSWLGMKRYIAVNCTGMVSEGLYPE